MPMPSSTRYVVLDWPRTGSGPELADTVVYTSLIDAHDVAADLGADAKRDGRANTFTVHAVDMDVIDR
jgi:hypothetical protein